MQVCSTMPHCDSSLSESSLIVRLVGFSFKLVGTYEGMAGNWKASGAAAGIGWVGFDVFMDAINEGWQGGVLEICGISRA